MSQLWRLAKVPESQVQDVLGHPGTIQDVPAWEAGQGPRAPGPTYPGISLDKPGYVPAGEAGQGPRVPCPRCPGTSRDNPECPSWGGRARSQSRRSNISWDILGQPRMSQLWRLAKVPEFKVQDVLGYPWTIQDVPAVEAGQGPRVPGPRYPGISPDNPGCLSWGGRAKSQSPRSKMSWDIPGQPRMSQLWRQGKVPESQLQNILGHLGQPRVFQLGRQGKVPEPQVQDVLGYPRTTQDVPAGEAGQGPRAPGPRCPGISPDNPGCPSWGGRARSQRPRFKMSWDISGQPRMSQLGRVPESLVPGPNKLFYSN